MTLELSQRYTNLSHFLSRIKLHIQIMLKTLILQSLLGFSFKRLPQALILCSNHNKKILWNVKERLHGWIKKCCKLGFLQSRVLSLKFIAFLLILNKIKTVPNASAMWMKSSFPSLWWCTTRYVCYIMMYDVFGALDGFVMTMMSCMPLTLICWCFPY